MASNKEFTVTELRQPAGGSLVDSDVRFVWDAKTQTSPRNFWEYPIKLRTVREDYPGTSRPTEQILGSNFEPFTFEGVWDDRYAGEGFAESTRTEFEKMVRRGSLVRVAFEKVSVVGLITNFTPTYRRSFQVAYKFTLSPHFRSEKESFEAGRIRGLAPDNIATDQSFVDDVQARVNEILNIQKLAPAAYIVADALAAVTAVVDEVQRKMEVINAVVKGRTSIDPISATISSAARLSASFESMRNSASKLFPVTRSYSTDTHLFYEDAIAVLAFETWIRSLNASMRSLVYYADKAFKETARRAKPDALSHYRPYAGESLYAISNLFYSTPHRWHDIYERNHLSYLIMTGTEILIIPSD